MQTTASQLPPTLPIVPASLTRDLTRRVLIANGVALFFAAAVIAVLNRPGYWPAFAAGAAVGCVGAGVSVLILSMAAGRTVDWLVTYVMGASAVRLFVSLLGLVGVVKLFGTSLEVTSALICLFYVITLGVESQRLYAAASPVGDKHV